jgi:DNA helicase HerA-like ATPase
MTIASQRPSDISATIISQLHNYFLHRLINNNDLLAVEKTISYLDKVSADSIPNLATGTCISTFFYYLFESFKAIVFPLFAFSIRITGKNIMCLIYDYV